jgi:hypothetical protein
MRLRGFVPVEQLAMEERPPEEAGAATATEGARTAPAPAPALRETIKPLPRAVLPDGIDDWERRVSLFGEAEG